MELEWVEFALYGCAFLLFLEQPSPAYGMGGIGAFFHVAGISVFLGIPDDRDRSFRFIVTDDSGLS